MLDADTADAAVVVVIVVSSMMNRVEGKRTNGMLCLFLYRGDTTKRNPNEKEAV